MAEEVPTVWKVRASVPTGLEVPATEECAAVLGMRPATSRGYVEITISSLDQLHQVDSLRSIENLSVVVAEIKNFCHNKSDVLQRLESLPGKGNDWLNALKAWRFYNSNVLKTKKSETGKKDSPLLLSDKDPLAPQDPPAPQDPSAPQDPPPNTNQQEQSLILTSQNSDPSMKCSSDSSLKCSSDPSLKLSLDPSLIDSTHTNLSTETPSVPDPNPQAAQEPESLLTMPSDKPSVSGPNPQPVLEPESLSAIISEFKDCTFRVTATRSGPKTLYSSMDAAKHFASGVISAFQWGVDLKNFNIEVILTLNDEGIIVSVALTRESKYHRNLTHFGPTSLKATVAHGLLRLAHPKPGDVIIDPMCGGGSITIEGFYSFPSTYNIGADNHPLACKRTKDNLTAITDEMGMALDRPAGVPTDVLQWDVCLLPLRTASVDVIVTDLPFGKKIGSKFKNYNLYRRCLEECGRVCVPETGRSVFLTHDTNAMSAAMKALSSLWQRYRTYWINLGGLRTGVHILLRTKMKM